MIPAIGYSMRTADRSRPNSPADPRRLQSVSLNPQPTAAQPTVTEIDLESLNRGLDCLHDLETERVALRAASLLAGTADWRKESALSRLSELAHKSGAQAVIARLEPAPATSAATNAVPTPRAWKTETAELRRQVESVQAQLGEIPFYLESTVDAEWFKRNSHGKRVLRKVLAGTGCGWFLDVTALYVEAMNSAQDARDLLEELLPAADRVQLRLSGVCFDEKAERWIASDAHPIPEAVFELYAFVLEVAFEKVDAVFVRQNGTNADGEIETVREIAEGVGAIV